MLKIILFLITFELCNVQIFAQLHCKEIKLADGGSEKKCFHKNGRLSTIEYWDAQRRSGKMTGYSNQGVEIFIYGLRRFAGHSSVYLSYYENGQVKKAEYSSAPDGGIQFWRIIHYFDENGNQTALQDFSQPDGRPALHVTFDTSRYYKQEPKKEILQNNTKPAVPDCHTEFVLINESKALISILCKAKTGNIYAATDTIIQLFPKQRLTFYSKSLAEKFIHEALYLPELAMGKKKNNKFKVIPAVPVEGDNKKTYTWHVIKK